MPKIRIIRDGSHAGELSALKRFKDDVKEVAKDTIVVFKSKVIMT
jgi:translation initiation factor IF-2